MWQRLGLICFVGWMVGISASQLGGQQPGESSSKPKTKHSSAQRSTSDLGGAYRNGSFGFTYKIPFGWVDRTESMREDNSDSTKAQVLLAVFERPPEATGNTINSA